MLPRVILHNSTSIDGRIDWLTPDVELHYELAAYWQADAQLVGSETILTSTEEIPAETNTDAEDLAAQQPQSPGDTRPLLVIPDSRGRVRTWDMLHKMPHWRGAVALCTHSTAQNYLDYLDSLGVDYILVGEDLVDLRAALEALHTTYGIKTVLVDSGGTLNGALLRAGLVNEVSLLIYPSLVGGTTPQSFFRAPDLAKQAGVITLDLIAFEQVRKGIIWLRYTVKNQSA
jgi:2,5-diamino-6-(ribosylamino)-4(3H)-pyrimidinone 5'-phosphate reductase